MGPSFVVLACLVGAALAGPLLRQNECATRCPEHANSKFDYEVGKKYVYEYSGENIITVAGEPKQKARIEGLAEIHILSKCEAVLRLRNVRIEQKLTPQEIDELSRHLEIPVTFAFNDGEVEHVCPSSEDIQQSLNIKKGIISTLINTMSKLDTPQEVRENDCLGSCITKYTVKYDRGLEITKEKSLKSCTNWQTAITSLITNPYENPNSSIHSLPVFPQETATCKQLVENKVIKSVECMEESRIKPLKQRESVIEFRGVVRLSLLSKDPIDIQRSAEPQLRESISYNLNEIRDLKQSEREAEVILRAMCSKNIGSIDVNVSTDFIRLVHLVKDLPYQSLEKTYSSLKDGRVCSSKKVLDIYMDALPMAGSEESIKLMVKLLESKEVEGLKAKVWPVSLAMIQKPTKETVAAIVPLLKSQTSAPVLLGVSALVHRFCSRNNCETIQPVHQIVDELNRHLGEKCSSENEEMVIKALKAFGNMGFYGNAESNIIACARDTNRPIRVRLAAVDAFRRSQNKRPNELLKLYQNKDEDYEIRIAALSSVIRQADMPQLQEIRATLEHETDNQVSGYAWTLIRNMNKTSSPLKREVSDLLNNLEEIEEPKLNYWETSKNLELSQFSKNWNFGAGIEADVIHSSESKIPRSLYSRFDIDLFDKNMNIFEFGLRAEGLEQLVKNLIGLKDRIPKNPSWDMLNAKQILGEHDAEVSMLLRTMNTEIFDISASELSGLSEMIEIADVMNKLAHGRKSDFSHSFLFMNSKLVIPSVTGRAYSVDMTGSATVGLTASTKLNLLSFPRTADAHLHFQPSTNIEISTTVGIQSNLRRPDVKLISRVHLESNMEARFQIKDGHVALASLSLPTENVLYAKVSTDVVEIDSHHNERRVYDKMQKKIDYCFDKLHKPLGVSVCATLEVPKPFVTKSFPFLHPVINAEFAVKKSDDSFRSFEIALEIPKQTSSVMKYSAALDTPGSRTARRFAAELHAKQEGKGQREITLNVVSPFQSANGKGSYIWRDDKVQGTFELHSGPSRLLSANLSTEIATIKARKILKPSLEISFRHMEPIRVGGSVSIIRGRKQQISIDLKANRPSSKPLTLTGTIMKEGDVELSETADWKLSSDLAVQSAYGEAQLHSAVEKQSKQAQTISTSLSLDYQVSKMQKQSIQFSGSCQKSSGKISTNAQFEMTQLPPLSWKLNWNRQVEPNNAAKNEILLKYGRQSEKNYISIKERSQALNQTCTERRVSVSAPQFNVTSELKMTHDFKSGEMPKLFLETDLSYKLNKHVRSLLRIDYVSRKPLRGSSRFEFESPRGKVAYWDEVEEKNGAYEGKSNLQWRENKKIEVSYKYKKSQFQHALEAYLKAPFLRSPLNSKALVKMSSGSLRLEGEMSQKSKAYSLLADLNKVGVSKITLKSPQIDGELKISNETATKALEVDVHFKSIQSPSHLKATLLKHQQKESMKKFEAELKLDSEQDAQPKFFASTKMELNKVSRSFIAASRLQISDLIDLSLSESGDLSLRGRQEFSVVAQSKHFKPQNLRCQLNIAEGSLKSSVKYSKNHVEKVVMDMECGLKKSSNKYQVSASAALQCPDNSCKTMELLMNNEVSRSGSSLSMKSKMSVQRGPNHIYKATWKSNLQHDQVQMKSALSAINNQIKSINLKSAINEIKSINLKSAINEIKSINLKSAINRNLVRQSIVVLRSINTVSSEMSLEIPKRGVISLKSDIQKRSNSIETTCTINSPFEIVRDAKIHMSVENLRNKKSIVSYIDVNNARLSEISGNVSLTQQGPEVQALINIAEIPNLKFHGLNFTLIGNKRLFAVSGKVDLVNRKEMSVNCEIRKEQNLLSFTTNFTTPLTLLRNAGVHLSMEKQSSMRNITSYMEANGERKYDLEILMSTGKSMEVQGRLKLVRQPEISVRAQVERSGRSFTASAICLKENSPRPSRHGLKFSPISESSDNTLLNLQVEKKMEGDSPALNAKCSGSLSPFSFAVSASHNDKNSLSMEAKACRETEKRTCYSLKHYHKTMVNSESYDLYQKATIDLERVSGNSHPENLGSVQYLLSAKPHDYRSKILFQLREKTVGYEMKLHRRDNEEDRCSFDTQIFAFKKSQISGSIQHSRKLINLELVALPNVEEPTRKYTVEMKAENKTQSNELSGYLKVNGPRLSKPCQLTVQLQTARRYPVSGQIQLQHPEGSVTLEAQRVWQENKKSIVYKLYNDKKSIDCSVVLMQEKSPQEDVYKYEWTYKSQMNEKKGGINVKLHQKVNGKPQSVDIAYYTPSLNLKLQGRSETPMRLSVFSSGKKIQEVLIRTTDNCVNLEVLRSEPLFTSSICLNQKVAEKLHLLRIESEYRRHKCLEMSISMEPESPAFIDITMQWNKDDLTKALIELSGLNQLLQDKSLEEIEEEIKRQLKEYRRDVLKPILEKWLRKFHALKQEWSRKWQEVSKTHVRLIKEQLNLNECKEFLRSYLDAMPWEYIDTEIVRPLRQIVKCLIDGYLEVIYKHVPDFWRLMWEVSKEQFENCMKKVCHEKSFCYDIFTTYQRQGPKRAQALIQRKLSKLAESLRQYLPEESIRIPRQVAEWYSATIPDFGRYIQEYSEYIKVALEEIFGKVVSHKLVEQMREELRVLEQKIREQFMEQIDRIINYINEKFGQAAKDEDFKTAKALVMDWKKKLVKAWRNKEEIAEKSWHPVKATLLEGTQKALKSKLDVQEFNIKDGVISVRVPLNPTHLQVISTEIKNIQRKLMQKNQH